MGTKKKYFSFKRILVIALLFVVIIGAGAFINSKNSQLACASDPSLMKQASVSIKNNDNKSLLAIVNKITKKSKYANDPNCDFIVMSYYINISDGKNAQISYNELKKVFNSKNGLDSKISDTALPIDTYKGIIEYLITQSNQPIKRFLPESELSK
jgi:hypothetical protein